uniref:Uncharacterized protein n=1 Tax=Kalanchoe fedtschenkoi TaxID=63787 RepID=A0A7N0UDY6_KALFE
MSARRDIRCSGCMVQLKVPLDARTIRCSVCYSITRVPRDPLLDHVEDSINQSWGFFKGLVTNVSAAVAASLNPSPGAHQYGYGYGHGSHLPPVRPHPTHVPVSVIGRRRAVLCGVSYRGTTHSLERSVSDVRCMNYFLLHTLGLRDDSILILTEDEADPTRKPTKANILTALQWLVQGCKSGDSLIFHFSGHGSRQFITGDRTERYIEGLFPVDHEVQGLIEDQEINAAIVRQLPQGARLHAIVDASHARNVLGLPYICRINREGYYLWEDHSYTTSSQGGLTVLISSCEDYETAANSSGLLRSPAAGAMTCSFIQAVQNEPGATYGRLLLAMRYAIGEAKSGVYLSGTIASLVRKALHPKSPQEPLLSSSEKFDIHSKTLML